jgi:nitroreductase
MDILEKLRWRYATKKFDSNRILSQDHIDILTEAFNLTATSFGLQPLKLVIVKDKVLQARLVQYSMNQQQVAQASHILIFCIDTNIDKSYIEGYFNRIKAIRNTSDEILDPFREYLIDDFEKQTQADIEDWATKQAYLAMGNLLTVCAVEGIDSCPMEGFDPAKYDEIFGLREQGLKSVLVMPVGYRAEDDMFADFKKVRKDVKDIIVNL